MDINAFVRKTVKRLRMYSVIYALLNFLLVFLIFSCIGILLNFGSFMILIEPLSPYVGLSPNLPLIIKYENIAVLCMAFILTIPIVCISKYIRKRVTVSFRTEGKKLSLEKKRTEKPDKAIRLIEKKYPELKEKLRTAYDSVKKCASSSNKKEYEAEYEYSGCNIIQKDLIKKVSYDIENVELSKLFHKKRTAIKSVSAIILTVAVCALLITGIQAPITADSIVGAYQNITQNTTETSIFPDMQNKTPENFIPDNKPPTISMETGKPVNVILPPGDGIGPGSELESDPENRNFTVSRKYPLEALASDHYNQNIPEGYKEMIQKYFEKNAETN